MEKVIKELKNKSSFSEEFVTKTVEDFNTLIKEFLFSESEKSIESFLTESLEPKSNYYYILVRSDFNWADEMDITKYFIQKIEGDFDVERFKKESVINYSCVYEGTPEEELNPLSLEELLDKFGECEISIGTNEEVSVSEALINITFAYITKKQYEEYKTSGMFNTCYLF